LEPAPDRIKKTRWTEFLKKHWDVLSATDFFTVDIWTGRGLTRFALLFVIDLATRRVEIAGAEPDSTWMRDSTWRWWRNATPPTTAR
jgi:transposase InsO family protein